MFVRADVEFEDGLDMDFLLHKPLYFNEPEWFHDLTNEKINKIVCSYSDWDILNLIDNKTSNKTINIVIFDDGMIQIEDIKENQNPLISTYQVNKTYIQQFFKAMKLNLEVKTHMSLAMLVDGLEVLHYIVKAGMCLNITAIIVQIRMRIVLRQI